MVADMSEESAAGHLCGVRNYKTEMWNSECIFCYFSDTNFIGM